MARISAGIATSHVPAIGAALDLGKAREEYWAPVFEGYDFSKQWIDAEKPDVIFLVYNDHASAFDLKMILTASLISGAIGWITLSGAQKAAFDETKTEQK